MTYTVGFDTEFNQSSENPMNVVCAVLCFPQFTVKYWFPEDLYKFKNSMDYIREEKAILLAYAAQAEGRSLLSLGIDPMQFNWIDLYAEFRMLCNSNNQYNYGSFIGEKGEELVSYPPKDEDEMEEDEESDKESNKETPKNLVNALYKLLGVKVDTEQKTDMRDLIIGANSDAIVSRKDAILDYCLSDTQYLRALDLAIQKAYKDEGMSDFRKDQLMRGEYSIAVSKSEHLGMPINMDLLDRIIEQTPKIIDMHKEEVNKYFPFFIPFQEGKTVTLKNGKVKKFKDKPPKKDMAAYQKYVTSLNIPNFPVTATGKYKADSDTLEEWGYWEGLAALWKHNKTDSSLKWFKKDNKDGFFDRVGSDSYVRPYFGIFGTQTGRNAAKAKTFPLAMSSWLRTIIKPPHGFSIIGSDFSQQEVYVAAILSGDENLLEAYNSGDVYLAFAKQAGLIPKEATKSSHKFERNLCKSTVLGLQFGMGHNKLKVKLKLDSGQEVTDEKTAELIQAHKDTYKTYWRWVKSISSEYQNGTPLATNDGWVLWQDNPVITSVRNFPVQGNSASITRFAVAAAWKAGLQVMCSLHDALYIISKEENVEKDQQLLEKLMISSTAHILNQKIEECTMRVDTKVITRDEYWVEEKGQEDWNKLKEFLL